MRTCTSEYMRHFRAVNSVRQLKVIYVQHMLLN